ncbi:MAG: phosphoribosylformylglycinamidine synthase, partial [Christensenellales bacterium]
MLRRVFVEKKSGFDGEAQSIRHDLRSQLQLPHLENVRVLVRYDVAGLDEATWEKACRTIFSEPMVDNIYQEEMPQGMGHAFARMYLPGQYDQRADSAAQCVQMLTQGEQPNVRVATVFGLIGDLSKADIAAVQNYLVNPVDSMIGPLEKPDTLQMDLPAPPDVPVMEGFTKLDKEGMTKLAQEMGLAMSVEDALFVAAYFRGEGRDPSLTEIRVIDTYWSDHCRHTTFLTRLDTVSFETSKYRARIEEVFRHYLAARGEIYGEKISERPLCLMDLGTMGARLMKKRGLLPDLDESEEINACSIRADIRVDGKTEPWLIMFKNETHNHPTEIEPFGGAATCLGGAIRDPLSGRSYVYQAMRVTGGGDPRVPISDTLPGKLPQRRITREASHGYSSYGNQIGLATGQVTEIYHDGYIAKHMEIGAVIGAAPEKNVVRERPRPGDAVVILGGRTGRDGCGGATGSSKAHTKASIETCGAEVQKGNPITERKLQRLFRNPEVSRLIKRCNDFGAGGVCVAVGELADGLDIDLDLVPRKYEGLDGTELAISESQERMAVVLDPQDVDQFLAFAAKENLEATKIASVTDTGRMRMTWRGQLLVDISRDFLGTNGVLQHASAHVTAPEGGFFKSEPAPDPKARWMETLSSLSAGSQRGLSERFDATIGAATVLMPYAGAYQATPAEAMAAKLPVLSGETDDGTIMTFGYDADLSSWSPFHGACYAVVESLLKLACAGGDIRRARLTFQEYFKRLHDDPARWGEPVAALLGAYHAQERLDVAAIGGKDSMSGSFEDLDVPPTLVSFAVAPADMRRVISGEFKRPGSALALIKLPRDEDDLPDFEAFKALCRGLKRGIHSGAILSAYTLRPGGLAETVSKMAFGNLLGAELDVGAEELFRYAPGSAVIEVAEEADVKMLFDGSLLPSIAVIGRVTAAKMLSFCSETVDLLQAKAVFEGVLENVFPIRRGQREGKIPSKTFTGRSLKKPQIRTSRPRVLIPVFPGTNCEYDTARAFIRAGAVLQIIVVKNTVPSDIPETIDALERAMKNAQIIVLPGGFSAGDEPDGSGKFIATAL